MSRLPFTWATIGELLSRIRKAQLNKLKRENAVLRAQLAWHRCRSVALTFSPFVRVQADNPQDCQPPRGFLAKAQWELNHA